MMFCCETDRDQENSAPSIEDCNVNNGENGCNRPKKNPYNFEDDFDEPYVKPKIRKVDSAQRLTVSSDDHQPVNCRNQEISSGDAGRLDNVTPAQHLRQFIVDNVAVSEQSDQRTSDENCQKDLRTTDGMATGADTEKLCDDKSTAIGSLKSANGDDKSDTTASDKVSSILPTQGCGRRVVYVHSQEMIDFCNQLPRIPMRAGVVHSLIEALGILKYVTVMPPTQIYQEQLLQFHSSDYIEFLQKVNCQEDEEKVDEAEAEQYGLSYDCPVEQGVFDRAALVTGATVTAAQSLCDKTYDVAINWCGGWHHAQRGGASGFCYINDIAIGILKLREKFSRILYVDLDLHHGDGVENAFCTTSHVMTVSFHKYAPGFFPGSGNIGDVGYGKGKYYTVNVPLRDGICDAEYYSVFRRVMASVRELYNPDAVVCQCGADGLAGDPMSSFNLSSLGYIHCVRLLLDWRLPLLLLGGGGYHHPNTARCWAALTALCVGRSLPQDVPDHKYFTMYGPDYEMNVQAGHRKDHNTLKNLYAVCRKISDNLQKLPSSKPQAS